MPVKGFTVLTIDEETDYLLSKLKNKTNSKSKQQALKKLLKGALN